MTDYVCNAYEVKLASSPKKIMQIGVDKVHVDDNRELDQVMM